MDITPSNKLPRNIKLRRHENNLNITKHPINMQMYPNTNSKANSKKTNHLRTRSQNFLSNVNQGIFEDFFDKGRKYFSRRESRASGRNKRESQLRSMSTPKHARNRDNEGDKRGQLHKINKVYHLDESNHEEDTHDLYPKTSKNKKTHTKINLKAYRSNELINNKLHEIREMMSQIANNNNQNTEIITNLLTSIGRSQDEKNKNGIFDSINSSAKTQNIYKTQSFSRNEVRSKRDKKARQKRKDLESGFKGNVFQGNDDKATADNWRIKPEEKQNRKANVNMDARLKNRISFSSFQPMRMTINKEKSGADQQNIRRRRFMSSNIEQITNKQSLAKSDIQNKKISDGFEYMKRKKKSIRKTKSNENLSKPYASETSEELTLTYESEASYREDDSFSDESQQK